ncbi:MAG: helix-turn-helix domain-containing protein, partial [Acidimicrobiales bacterium]
MDALAAATATAAAVSTVGSHFMLDGNTYKRGAELGFAGLDFYVTGRGGVLGDVDADVVTAAFTFFEPGHVRTQWDSGRAVMSPAEAAAAFAQCC